MRNRISFVTVTFVLLTLFSPVSLAKACGDKENTVGSVKVRTELSDAKNYYKKKQYNKSIELYKKITLANPNCAEAFHMLGKSYGRLAQDSNWFKAIKYAKKTGVAFEKAYKLDPISKEIKTDLIEFYEEAPSFLGGNSKKANTLKIKKLKGK